MRSVIIIIPSPTIFISRYLYDVTSRPILSTLTSDSKLKNPSASVTMMSWQKFGTSFQDLYLPSLIDILLQVTGDGMWQDIVLHWYCFFLVLPYAVRQNSKAYYVSQSVSLLNRIHSSVSATIYNFANSSNDLYSTVLPV